MDPKVTGSTPVGHPTQPLTAGPGPGVSLTGTSNVMGMGEFAHFRDPDGNLIGLWRDASEG